MHSLKATLVNKEQKRSLKEKADLNLIATLQSSTSQPVGMFSKQSKLQGASPFNQSGKQITIKKILNDLERDLNKVEEENYHLVKEQAEIRELKANPKLALQKQKQLEKELMKQPSIAQIEKQAKLSLTQKPSTKKIIKDVNTDHLQFLNGHFSATIKLNKFEDEDQEREKPVYTYQQHRLLLKKQGVTYFEKYQPPKKETSENAKAQADPDTQDNSGNAEGANKPRTPPMTNNLMRNFSLPVLNEKKKKNPNSQKQDQDAMIFNEVFIKPRAVKLNQIMLQHQIQQMQQQGTNVVNKSLPPLQQRSSSTLQKPKEEEKATKYFLENREQRLLADKQKPELGRLLQSQKLNDASQKLLDQDQDLNNRVPTAYSHQSALDQSELLDQNDPLVNVESNHMDDIVKIVMRKFNKGASLKHSQSFFTQQIQVQPPEGMINAIGGNVKETSWAPSIPVSTAFLKQQSLKDITLRAKAGVQAGDIQKEAHMAFALGNLNEDQKNFKKAIKFYKRFFFCARILEDPVGASLGLNRLGVMYHKLKNYGKYYNPPNAVLLIEKSLQFHLKHQQFTDSENLFASYYNLGIAYRLQKQFDESVTYFKQALEWALQHQELESECISNGQLGVTYLIIKNNEQAKLHFEDCLKVASNLKNKKLQLDCVLCLGYIAYTAEDYIVAKNYFNKGFNIATKLNDKEIAEQCLCNMGISKGRIQIDTMKRNFSVGRIPQSHEDDSEEDS